MRMRFTLGAKARCTDGVCGVVTRTIVDPAAGTITHLVVEPRHQKEGDRSGRLVPVQLVDVRAGDIVLRCTLAEFSGLDPAEEAELVEDRDLRLGATTTCLAGAGAERAPGASSRNEAVIRSRQLELLDG